MLCFQRSEIRVSENSVFFSLRVFESEFYVDSRLLIDISICCFKWIIFWGHYFVQKSDSRFIPDVYFWELSVFQLIAPDMIPVLKSVQVGPGQIWGLLKWPLFGLHFWTYFGCFWWAYFMVEWQFKCTILTRKYLFFVFIWASWNNSVFGISGTVWDPGITKMCVYLSSF